MLREHSDRHFKSEGEQKNAISFTVKSLEKEMMNHPHAAWKIL